MKKNIIKKIKYGLFPLYGNMLRTTFFIKQTILGKKFLKKALKNQIFDVILNI